MSRRVKMSLLAGAARLLLLSGLFSGPAAAVTLSVPPLPSLMPTNNLSDLANPSTARANLGLGSAATQGIGTSGANIPLLSTANTWSAPQSHGSNAVSGSAFVITGGTLDGTCVGCTTPAAGAFTSLSASAALTATGTLTGQGLVIAGGAAAGKVTLSANNIAMASGQNLTLGMGGSGSTFSLSGTGGTGLLLVATASSTQNVIDLTGSANNLLKANKVLLAPGTITYSGAFVAGFGPLDVSDNVAGTATGTDFPFHAFTINSDTAAATGLGVGYSFIHNVAAGATGSRTTMKIARTQTAASGNAAAGIDPTYETARITSDAYYPEGGTGLYASMARGHQYSAPLYCRMWSGATNWYANVCSEMDVQVAAGASVARNLAFHPVQLSPHAVQGYLTDAAILIGNQSGAIGWRSGIQFADSVDSWSINANGSMFTAGMAAGFQTTGMGASYGIDIQNPLFAQAAFRTRGMSIGPTGIVRIGTGYLAPLSTGLSIDASGLAGLAEGATISGAAIVSGGTGGFSNGDTLTDAYNGVYYITANTGAITQLTVWRQSWAPAGTSATVTLTPNSASQGAGTVTITQTWTSGTLLTLNPSGGAVEFGSGAFTANGTQAASLGSLAPSSAHTTVQEWLTLKDASGTVRYLPTF